MLVPQMPGVEPGRVTTTAGKALRPVELSRSSELSMEKIVTCTKCQKTFKVSGPYSKVKDVLQGFSCPFCGESNEVMWPIDTGFTTIPESRRPNSGGQMLLSELRGAEPGPRDSMPTEEEHK